MAVRDSELVLFWGDLHGQSEEKVGTGTAKQYFAFARDRAFLDACAHQGERLPDYRRLLLEQAELPDGTL